MSRTIDYYLSLGSTWAYIGHAAFMDVARRHGVTINYKPMMLGQVFSKTGGLPLPQRHPARQRYRLLEMQRWRERRGLPLNLNPKHARFDASLADRFVIAILAAHQDPDAFLRAAFAGIWVEERDLSDRDTILELAARSGLDGPSLMERAEGTTTEVIYALNLENAVGADVFGSPAYVLDGEVFWGQDRLDLLDDALSTGRPAYRPE
ncbi:MAG TPA: 2-hydroxychromene-2-carboxylate isomerase [Beijerinckiaceae bacterium]|jgi:2-hydroxychromene-2-carboxylate isomerase